MFHFHSPDSVSHCVCVSVGHRLFVSYATLVQMLHKQCPLCFATAHSVGPVYLHSCFSGVPRLTTNYVGDISMSLNERRLGCLFYRQTSSGKGNSLICWIASSEGRGPGRGLRRVESVCLSRNIPCVASVHYPIEIQFPPGLCEALHMRPCTLNDARRVIW